MFSRSDGRRPVPRDALEHHVVLLAPVHEGGDDPGAQHGLQGPADGLQGDPQVEGPVAIDVDLDLGLGREEVRAHAEDLRVVRGDLGDDLVLPGGQLLVGGAAEDDGEPGAARADRQAGWQEHRRDGARQLGHLAADLGGQLLGGALADRAGLQGHVDEGRVHVAAGAPHARAGDHALDVAGLHVGHDHGLDLLDLPVHVARRRALGGAHHHEHHVAVFGGRVLAGQDAVEPGAAAGPSPASSPTAIQGRCTKRAREAR